MICPTCIKEGALVRRKAATKFDRCGRCSSWKEEFVFCQSCKAQYCLPCFDKVATAPPKAPQRFRPGPADDQSVI